LLVALIVINSLDLEVWQQRFWNLRAHHLFSHNTGNILTSRVDFYDAPKRATAPEMQKSIG
jgi:hypothetical protein